MPESRQSLVLDGRETWPPEILTRLQHPRIKRLVSECQFTDSLVEADAEVRELCQSIDAYALRFGVHGFHCTKELPHHSYAQCGLRVLNFERQHSEFLAYLRTRDDVDAALIRDFEIGLADWRKMNVGVRREQMVWFCLSRNLALCSGTTLLFERYGGESIYRAFKDKARETEILKSIGKPVVVEARLAAGDLPSWTVGSFGKTLVSHYCRSINPEFFVSDIEGYVSHDVPASDIVAVHEHADFARAFGPYRD